MDKKLTLSLDESVIADAKSFAKKNGLSLSRMVESFFKHLISEKNNDHNWSPAIKELTQAAEPAGDYDEKAVITKYLEEKYK